MLYYFITKNKIRKNKQNKINKQKNKKQTNMLTSMKDKSSKYCIIEPVVGDRIYEDVSHICQPTIGSCNISQVSLIVKLDIYVFIVINTIFYMIVELDIYVFIVINTIFYMIVELDIYVFISNSTII
jgi:hypothetical protein